jgi:hypothetical protein
MDFVTLCVYLLACKYLSVDKLRKNCFKLAGKNLALRQKKLAEKVTMMKQQQKIFLHLAFLLSVLSKAFGNFLHSESPSHVFFALCCDEWGRERYGWMPIQFC